MTIKELKKGDYFTFKQIDEPKDRQVWVRDEYDRSSKKFLVYCFGDFNKQRLVNGDKVVFIDFTF